MEYSSPDANTFGRILMGIHIVAFYVISIRMVFVKNISKWVILLILFPATAVITYIVMLFLRPRPQSVTSPAKRLFLRPVLPTSMLLKMIPRVVG